MLHWPSALFYGIMSIWMVFLNKYIISAWQFNNPILLILLEMLVNIALIHLISYWSQKNGSSHLLHSLSQTNSSVNKMTFDGAIVSSSPSSTSLNLGLNLDAYSKYQYLIVFFYCFHSVLSLKALSGLNIPIYVIFKRCVPLANLLISIFVFKNVNVKDWHTQKIIFSILAMTTGVIIAGIGDIDFNLSAYLYCAVSIVAQAGYLSSIQKHGEASSNAAANNSLQSLYDCSILSVPILFVIFVVSNEPAQVASQLATFDASKYVLFALLLVSNLVSGSLLCFTQFWCTLNNNAVTTSVLGVLKSMLQTLLGIVLFQSWSDISVLTYVGILINFVFGFYYTYLKHREHIQHDSSSKV